MSGPSSARRLLFVGTDLRQTGGANCVSAWTLQALQDTDWAVTVLSAVDVDFDWLNRQFGTALDAAAFTVRTLPFPLAHVNRLDPDPFSIQRQALLMRWSGRMARDFDVVMACDDEVDFGVPGIQYTHYPYLARHLEVLREAEQLTLPGRLKGLASGRFRPWMWLSGFRLSRVLRNRWVTNSQWTAAQIENAYGVPAQVLHPPVHWTGASPDWPDRGDAFVVLGRISPEKRVLELVEIVDRVRERGYPATLDIVGDIDTVAGQAYVDQVGERLARSPGLGRLHVGVGRAQLQAIVAGARYGLHGMHGEHFGIAVAEMVRAGCIVFVHDSGGAVEIVGGQAALCYRSDDEAVEKICAMLGDAALRDATRDALTIQADLFSEQRFMQEMRDLVEAFAGERQAAAGPGVSGRMQELPDRSP